MTPEEFRAEKDRIDRRNTKAQQVAACIIALTFFLVGYTWGTPGQDGWGWIAAIFVCVAGMNVCGMVMSGQWERFRRG